MTVKEYFITVGSTDNNYTVNIYQNRDDDDPIGVLYNAAGESVADLFGEDYISNSSGNDICIIVSNIDWDAIISRFHDTRISIRENFE